ncbi:hypothetical protein KY49_732 [Burkholderia sp. MSHR3999]|uniref:hypothetical protein n=1 Tax=Burkholderia sp. MSHR3999 TaxID=1542965 RepID=UPI0005B6CAE2|nr:hypothetical protein [Burkholderia sp. MSHR3999]KIP14419.1 hypothetical protein KY49_732 [Burkholderia sp. MSHR3999]
MDYTTVKNPSYAAADESRIACEVMFAGFDQPVPFLASKADIEQHGQQIYDELVAGKYGDIAPYSAPTLTPAQQYDASISQGLAVTSASSPEMNAIYGVAPDDEISIAAEAQFISVWQEFTNGEQTLPWADITGKLRVMPSTAVFMAVAKAAARYVSGCKQARAMLESGGSASFPSNQVAID